MALRKKKLGQTQRMIFYKARSLLGTVHMQDFTERRV